MALGVVDSRNMMIPTIFPLQRTAIVGDLRARRARNGRIPVVGSSSIAPAFGPIEAEDELLLTHEFCEEIAENRKARFDRPGHAN
jgi:hypothetical protein